MVFYETVSDVKKKNVLLELKLKTWQYRGSVSTMRNTAGALTVLAKYDLLRCREMMRNGFNFYLGNQIEISPLKLVCGDKKNELLVDIIS